MIIIKGLGRVVKTKDGKLFVSFGVGKDHVEGMGNCLTEKWYDVRFCRALGERIDVEKASLEAGDRISFVCKTDRKSCFVSQKTKFPSIVIRGFAKTKEPTFEWKFLGEATPKTKTEELPF